jgi:predicted AAA+ superfamily ATPase
VHASILETYKDDFAKYASGSALEKLRRVVEAVPSNIAQKVRYNRFHPDWKASDIRQCIEKLVRAGIADAVTHSDGTGLPLGATEDPTVAKLFHLDCALVGAASGAGAIPLEEYESSRFINEGPLAEQFVAQHLLRALSANTRPKLHYWLRGGRSVLAKVDFLIPAGGRVLPIEVKSGAAGSMRSLHQFMRLYPGGEALRLDLNPPSRQEIDVEVMTKSGRERVRYRLENLPLYLAERVPELMGEAPID